ncbi:hypothetical protein P152DRAFT_108112 [Eremomyces bilateralis CBS 781.70]|uniref:Uncharacterized protein n=1 Tax=Eremomyces bilateralis CBS 781.70 TaxID=1392243 RepID=A0A6G1GDN0_9PEZI|nr:uncharacterized protein P152DRAFT_108112 [Eremomyces bilateralis CBS 781.70]KAF1816020.1 hypothetical protein P152DRAFT_108112 [Eremomyces bilateralis CBS 781.70]
MQIDYRWMDDLVMSFAYFSRWLTWFQCFLAETLPDPQPRAIPDRHSHQWKTNILTRNMRISSLINLHLQIRETDCPKFLDIQDFDPAIRSQNVRRRGKARGESRSSPPWKCPASNFLAMLSQQLIFHPGFSALFCSRLSINFIRSIPPYSIDRIRSDGLRGKARGISPDSRPLMPFLQPSRPTYQSAINLCKPRSSTGDHFDFGTRHLGTLLPHPEQGMRTGWRGHPTLCCQHVLSFTEPLCEMETRVPTCSS